MPEEEQPPQLNAPETPRRPGGGRHRGRRGGRGRRRPLPVASPEPSPEGEPRAIAEPREPREADAPAAKQPAFQQPPPRRRGSPLLEAADEAAEIIESLKQTLGQMEEVLELIELAERQKITDEREIESLRRALRQIQSRRPE